MDGWRYDKHSDTWLYGSTTEGCGVYLDNGGWYGNLVFRNFGQVLGPFATIEEAKANILEHFEKRGGTVVQNG